MPRIPQKKGPNTVANEDVLTLRTATMGDARLLHVWRNDPETRRASRNSNPVSWPEHEVWLSNAIASPDRLIRVVEEGDRPVGVVRADRTPAGWELSWTVAPEARGRGVGRRMLQQFVSGLDGRLTAVVRSDNAASARIAAAAGLGPVGQVDASDFELWANDRKRRPVFFFVNTTGLFDELFRLAKRLQVSDIEPVFYFAFGHWTVERDSERCRAAGIRVVRDDAIDASAAVRGLGRIRDLFGKLGRRRSWAFAASVSAFLSELISLRLSLARARKLLSLTDAEMLVLSCDLAGYDSGAYVKTAHRLGKKVIIVTSIMSNGMDVAEFVYRDAAFHVTGAVRRAIGNVFPKWVLSHREKNLFRVQPPRILALELLGLAPPRPWLFNSSRADAIILESQAMADYSATAGMAREQMRVLGSTADDVMTETLANRESRHNELCRSLGLPVDRPIILTALPTNFLHVAGGRPECDFPDYESLVDFWVKSLSAVKGHNVVISLHPSAKADDLRDLERHGARISTLLTPQLIPLCRFYVANVSSTIRWAIACGKPVIDYDIYRYHYTDDFDDLGGVLTVDNQTDFFTALNRLAYDKEFFREVEMKQMAVSQQWGFLDGKCGDRMARLVNDTLSASVTPSQVRMCSTTAGAERQAFKREVK